MEDIMSAPAWFNYETYLVNKLAQLKTADPEQYGDYTEAELKASMLEAGYSNDADGMYQHFEQFGNAENVSPSPYFVVSEYLANKLTQLQTLDPEQYGSSTVTDVANSFAEAGLSAWDHYTLFGQAEGVSPSAIFDNNAYLAAKLEQLKTLDPAQYGEYTVEDVVNAFAAEGLNPIEHYMLFGINEDLSYSPVTPEPPVTDELTTARDVLTLDAGDSIIAGVASALSAEKTLNENDLIDGGEGNDTLRVTLDANFNGFTVTDDPNTTGGMKNVENVELTNNGSIARTFSAKGSEGVTTYTLHAGEAGTGAINLKDLAAAGITVNVDGLQKGTTDVQFATGALSGAEDSMTFGLNNVGAAAASATADPTYVGLKATTGLESVTINASGVNYADLSGLDAASVAVTGAGSLEASAVNAALTSLDASAATGSVSADLSAATMQTVKGGAGDDTFIVKGLAPTAVLEGGEGNDTLIISESGAATLQPTVSGFETIGIADNTGAITLSAKNAQDFTTLLLENTGAKVTVANLSGSTFTVESLGAEKGAATTNTAVIADAVDLTVNVNAGDDAEKAQTVTTDITAASAPNAVINVGANVAAAGTFTFGAAQSVQLNVASNMVGDAEQTSFNGTITAAKAQSLEVRAEGALGSSAKFDVANAASVVLDAAQGGTAAIVAGKATDVRLTAGGDLSLSGSNLAAAQSVDVVQNEGRLDGSSIDLTGLNSLNVSGDGTSSAVSFKNMGSAANEYNLSVVATGLAAGFTAGTVESRGDISLDFSAVSGDVTLGTITGGADVSLAASQLGNNTFGAITAAGSVDVQAIGLLGDQLNLGDITATGDNSNVSLVVDGTATVANLKNISATGSVNVDLSGYMGEAFALSTIKGADVTYVGADLVANDLGTVTASSLNFTGGLEADTVILEGVANETSLTATLDTGTGTDSVTVNGVASTETITVSGDLGGDNEAVTVNGSAATSGMTINIGGLTGYATSAITGTSSSDTIIGGSGNDTITAGDVSFATAGSPEVPAVQGSAVYSFTGSLTGDDSLTIQIGTVTSEAVATGTNINNVTDLIGFINSDPNLSAAFEASDDGGNLKITEVAGKEGQHITSTTAPTITATGLTLTGQGSATAGSALVPAVPANEGIVDTLTGGAGADVFELSAASSQSTANTDTATTIITDFSTADGDTLQIGSLDAGSSANYKKDGVTYNSLSALLEAANVALDGTVKYVAAMFNGDTYIVAGDTPGGHSAIVQLQGVSLDQLDNDGTFIVNA